MIQGVLFLILVLPFEKLEASPAQVLFIRFKLLIAHDAVSHDSTNRKEV